jgi:hypothetical protein
MTRKFASKRRERQGYPILGKKGLQRAASPLPEREVSSHPPLLPAAAGGKTENWKALVNEQLLDKSFDSKTFFLLS